MRENRMTVIGSEMMPISIKNVFITPLRPRTGRNAKTRTSSEIMNGKIKSSTTRCCKAAGIRRRTNTAIGKANANDITTAIAACSMENR